MQTAVAPSSGRSRRFFLALSAFFYGAVFATLHNYVTNVWVRQSLLDTPILSNAVQFALGACLFRHLYRWEKARKSGLALFTAIILFVVWVAFEASREGWADGTGIFFPEFFPFYACINFGIIWIVFMAGKVHYWAVGLIIAAIVCAELYVLPAHGKTENESSASGFLSRQVQPFACVDTGSRTFMVPDSRTEVSILFFTFIECAPCQLMKPFMEEVCASLSSAKTRVYKVNPVNKRERVRVVETGKLANHCLRTLLPVNSDAVEQMIGFRTMPLMVILDRQGNIVYSHLGYESKERKMLMEQVRKFAR